MIKGGTGKRILAALLFMAVILLAAACSSEDAQMEEKADREIMIVSDTHLLAPELEGSSTYTKSALTQDGRVQDVDVRLLKALVDKVNEIKPEVLCLTGDLTFNGERESHLALTEILSQVNESTKVLVIPGNHDCYNLKAYTYKNDDPKHIKSITYDDFKTIYSDYGYSGALSYDETGLSYIWPVSDQCWLLMLDTTLSFLNDLNGANMVGGYIQDETMLWLESNLKTAAENGIEVIAFSHHNLITHNSLFEKGYTIGNADEVLNLFQKYGVKINFSGHLHIQNIQEKDGIYDIASGSLLDYGNQYGILREFDDRFEYEREPLTLKGMDLQDYSFHTFCNKYMNRGAVNELSAKLNAYYFDGNYPEIYELLQSNPEEAEEIKESGNDYLLTLLDIPEVDQNKLTVLK